MANTAVATATTKAITVRIMFCTSSSRPKGEAGLDRYQVRAWRAWYADVTLFMLALAWPPPAPGEGWCRVWTTIRELVRSGPYYRGDTRPRVSDLRK